MSNENSLGASEIVPYLRLTASGTTYTLNALVTIPDNYTIGTCTATNNGSSVTVDIPVIGSNPSSTWKAVYTSCTLPPIGGGITPSSIITATVTTSPEEGTEDVEGGDPPVPEGSSKVNYEDFEEE